MTRMITLTAFAAALLIGGGAMAGEVPLAETGERAAADAASEASMSLKELDEISGRQGVEVDVLTTQQLSGSTSGNTVTAGTLTTGDVSFSQDALSGFSGVGNFVVNTGANNTLQGSINISVVTTPAS